MQNIKKSSKLAFFHEVLLGPTENGLRTITIVVIFAFTGKLAGICSAVSGTATENNQVSMTSGLTGDYVHACLPTIRPLHTAAMTALFILVRIFTANPNNVYRVLNK